MGDTLPSRGQDQAASVTGTVSSALSPGARSASVPYAVGALTGPASPFPVLQTPLLVLPYSAFSAPHSAPRARRPYSGLDFAATFVRFGTISGGQRHGAHTDEQGQG